jgi:hypothetical protein
MQRVFQSPVRIAASITLLLLLLLAGSEWASGVDVQKQDDFDVYLTAAQLVREHKGVDIYSDADTGLNPQIRFAAIGSTFQRTAASIGIPAVRLYVYPPTLADLLVPFTFFSVEHARDAWLIFNLLTILGAAMLVTWMLYDTALHVACIGFFVCILCFRANGWSFDEGQVSSALVLLWTAGIVCYVKGFKRTSAAVFALAAAIKLTPLLVVLPFLVWREWRWVRWFFLCLAVICVSLCAVNGPQSLLDYTLHVIPPMSAGATSCENTSLPSGLQQAYLGLTCSVMMEGASIPRAVQLVSKLISGAMLLLVSTGWGLCDPPWSAGRFWRWLLFCRSTVLPWPGAARTASPFSRRFFFGRKLLSEVSRNPGCCCSFFAPLSSASSSTPSASVSLMARSCPRQPSLHLPLAFY